jgi:hypothetical protein
MDHAAGGSSEELHEYCARMLDCARCPPRMPRAPSIAFRNIAPHLTVRPRGGDASFRYHRVTHRPGSIQQLVQGDRQVAYALAGGVIDGIGNCRPPPRPCRSRRAPWCRVDSPGRLLAVLDPDVAVRADRNAASPDVATAAHGARTVAEKRSPSRRARASPRSPWSTGLQGSLLRRAENSFWSLLSSLRRRKSHRSTPSPILNACARSTSRPCRSRIDSTHAAKRTKGSAARHLRSKRFYLSARPGSLYDRHWPTAASLFRKHVRHDR